MLGAIIGDIVGSVYERHNIKTKEFEFFSTRHQCRPTDDSIMTLAVANAILNTENYNLSLEKEAVKQMPILGAMYPRAGYGGNFRYWLRNPNPQPYNSYGNGAAMRVSPCGFAASSLEDAIRLIQRQPFLERLDHIGLIEISSGDIVIHPKPQRDKSGLRQAILCQRAYEQGKRVCKPDPV